MLDIFARHGVPGTFFIPGFDAENNPDVVRRVVDEGHEVAADGYLHERGDVPLDEEEALLRRSHQILTDLTGLPPIGWRSPGGKKSTRTLQVLRKLGYRYDSSDKDYDLPYPAIVAGEQSGEMIELPNNTSSLDDHPHYVDGAATAGEVLDLWTAEFDAIFRDTGYFLLTYHPRAGFGSGIPSRARVIDRLIAHIRTYPDVRSLRHRDLADWCLDPANGFIQTEAWIGGRP